MTDHERLMEIENRAAKATEGPWRDRPSVHGNQYRYVAIGKEVDGEPQYTTLELQPSDARFIAKARSDIPWLLAQLRAAMGERDRLASALNWAIAELEIQAEGEPETSSIHGSIKQALATLHPPEDSTGDVG